MSKLLKYQHEKISNSSAVVSFTPLEVQEVTAPTTDTLTAVTTTKISKKNNGQKAEK
ncbi:hypothetical protein C1645_837795, partial [Glomus cerebriforme]